MCVHTSNQTNKHFTIRDFSSYHPPGQKKEFTQGNVPQLLRANSSEKTFEKNINDPIEIQSVVLSQCESCIIYYLSLLIFTLHSFQIASSLSPILKVFTSSSLLLFGRFSFSFNIRFKNTTSGFKLNKYYNYNKTDSSVMFKLLLYSFGKKVERVNRLGLVC